MAPHGKKEKKKKASYDWQGLRVIAVAVTWDTWWRIRYAIGKTDLWHGQQLSTMGEGLERRCEFGSSLITSLNG